MTLNQLQHFESLARTQHYQRTAELLGISQPALSRSISALEVELGAPLFERRGRNVVLSRFGRVFAEHIRTAMYELDKGVTLVRELSDPEKGAIDISLTYAIANLYFPNILRSYVKDRAQTKFSFQFRQANTPKVLDDVREGLSEIGFCAYMEDQPEIRFYPLFRCPLCLVAPKNHSLAKCSSVTLEEIGQYPLILSVDQTHYTETLLQARGIEPVIACRMGEDRAIANLVSCGFGLSILPYDPQLLACDIALVSIQDPQAYRDFYMVVSKNRMLSASAKHFFDYVQKNSHIFSFDGPTLD